MLLVVIQAAQPYRQLVLGQFDLEGFFLFVERLVLVRKLSGAISRGLMPLDLRIKMKRFGILLPSGRQIID